MSMPKWMEKRQNQTPKEKSKIQEKSAAKRFKGRTTFGSGNLWFDKGDVYFRKIRLECKRTDKDYLVVTKEWLDKQKREQKIGEFYAMEVEVGSDRVYVIPEKEFRFLEYVLTTDVEQMIEDMQSGVRMAGK